MSVATDVLNTPVSGGHKKRYLVIASSVGTMIEWYDFFLYGSLAVFFSGLFYPPNNPTASLLISVATFATGFAVRPLGAILFGHMGDKVGRKATFLATLILMGLSTALIGVLPTYASAGLAAPLMLVLLRLLQGLALGGEYGGAATYVAEHSPPEKRGKMTSSIQCMASGGFFLSLVVVLSCRLGLGTDDFAAWGWRLPFLLSFVLVMFSVAVRMRLAESPVFEQMKSEGRTAKSPLRETLACKDNRRLILLVLFGVAAGQAVTFYTGQFYALYYLQSVLKVDFLTSTLAVAAGALLGMPFFLFFGAYSDRVGRKPLLIGGMVAAAIFYVPIYMLMRSAVTPSGVDVLTVGFCVFLQVVIAAAVYGPYAAFLVEAFPARIRYTSLSIPYHIGNGIFGGFLPLIGLSLVSWTGNPLAGLAYPIIVCVIGAIVSILWLRETKGTDINL